MQAPTYWSRDIIHSLLYTIFKPNQFFLPYVVWATRWLSWFRHCAKSRKVVGSIPDGVIGIFHWNNTSGRIMGLELTQPPTEMNTRNVAWGVKVAVSKGWQPYLLHVPIVFKAGWLDLLKISWSVLDCKGIVWAFTLCCFSNVVCWLCFSFVLTSWVKF